LKVRENPKLSPVGKAVIVVNGLGRRIGGGVILGKASVHAVLVPIVPPRSRLVEPVTFVGKTRTGIVSFTLSGPLTHHIV
jgi:hypothetical protein